ncbi:MAG: TIM-barrel domain-containing protein [Candidatus Eremiobacterota bacterium]
MAKWQIETEKSHVITGSIRISLLSSSLLRIEEGGSDGFEDRPTFLVINRDWSPVTYKINYKDNFCEIKTDGYMVLVEKEAKSIRDVKVYMGQKLLWNGSEENCSLKPLPVTGEDIYVLPDKPVILPPPWGALKPLSDEDKSSGWFSSDDGHDIYIFVYNKDLSLLRKEFLKLTGSVPLPPLWAFGFWNSLYHPYTDTEAIATIERYRKEGIPLDVFVVDTDWRVGGSSGYDIEKKYFPDMKSFFRQAHNCNVKIIMNDHPSSMGMKPVEPAQLKYRYENLTAMLSMGLDTWWYDKNWHEFIEGPYGTGKEVWGQYLYSGIISHFCPGMRTVLLSMWSDHPASHRYPLWWTGDIHSSWDDLRNGIRETLWFGHQCMPYVGQDLGGHVGDPDDELYTRFLQYGCLSPTARVHGTVGAKRYPWLYSEETKEIVTEYIKLRYRLLPVIYSAARRAFDEGLPLLRSLSFEWPEFDEKYLEYLLGDDLLVCPVFTQSGYQRIDGKFLQSDGEPGLKGEYFNNSDFHGEPDVIRQDREISFPPCSFESFPVRGETFSARWTGEIFIDEPGRYTFRTLSSDGVRLRIGDKLLIDNWTEHHETYDSAEIDLNRGYVPVKLEFYNGKGFWIIRLDWITPSAKKDIHDMWIPPGEWEDLWTGISYKGPAVISQVCPLYKTPLFIRRPSVITLAPEMDYSWQKPWDPVTIEIFPGDGKIIRSLYEDDGMTLEYEHGGYRKTDISLLRDGKQIFLEIDKPCGKFRGVGSSKSWIVRLHLKEGETLKEVCLDGKTLRKKDISVMMPSPSSWPCMPLRGKGSCPTEHSGPVVEICLEHTDGGHKIMWVLG